MAEREARWTLRPDGTYDGPMAEYVEVVPEALAAEYSQVIDEKIESVGELVTEEEGLRLMLKRAHDQLDIGHDHSADTWADREAMRKRLERETVGGAYAASSRTVAEQIDPSEHIDQDDDRYRGFRLGKLWLATAIGPDDQEGPLEVTPWDVVQYHLLPGPAFAGDERRLLHLREFAAAKARQHKTEVWIRRFSPDDEMEVFTP